MYAVVNMRLYGRACVCGYMRNLDEPRFLLIKLPTLRDCHLLLKTFLNFYFILGVYCLHPGGLEYFKCLLELLYYKLV